MASWSQRPLDPSVEGALEGLRKELGFGPLALRVGFGRGLRTGADFRAWIEPKLADLPSPSTIRDLDKACELLAGVRDQSIRVYGDYDVDGTSGAALLHWGLSEMGFRVDVQQPDRFKDGYGVHVWAIEKAAREGVACLITVDCGITALEPARRARELGVRLIIVDHHQVLESGELPQADAVIDPHRADCSSGLRELCGCGLAYFLLIGLRALGRSRAWFGDSSGPNLRDHLDLVALATAADQVPLVGANHILMAHGMRVLRRTKKWGLRALIASARITMDRLTPTDLAFRLGPRINASGRMSHAGHACELLMARQERAAYALAYELEQLNSERMNVQDQIWNEIFPRVTTEVESGRFTRAVVIADSGWHEGVVGILASRVVDAFRKPAIVLSVHEGIAKGSVRSDGRADVLAALRACEDLLVGFGGHRHAAGLRLRVEDLPRFTERFEASLTWDGPEMTTLVDGVCQPQDLTQQAIEELELLGPYGQGNPEPTFVLDARPQETRILKEKHYKYVFTPNSIQQQGVEGIWFRGVEHTRGNDAPADRWIGTPELNHFRGRTTPVFRIRRPAV